MRKYLWRNLAFLFCIVICLVGIIPKENIINAKSNKKQESSQFDIKAETALSNHVKVGRSSQMKVTITNHGENFNGLVQMITVVNDTNIMNQKDFSIASGETKTIEIPFRMQSGYRNIVVRITDEDENVFKTVRVKVKRCFSLTYFNGILTENKQGMGYLEKRSQTTWLDEKNMPDTPEEIDALDRIYINDFQTGKLSKEQYKVLKTWVEEGGDLIIGTGVNASKVLEIFQDDFLKGEIEESGRDNRAKLSFQGEEVYHNNKENYNIHNISVGKGSVWVYDIDLSLPVSKWEETGGNYLSYQLIQQFGSADFPSTENEEALYMSEGFNLKDLSDFPNILLYSIIFAIYIVGISFFVYKILKKYDKLEKTWIAVPAVSIIFVILIYILGSSTRITGPFITYQGEIRFSGESDTEPFEKDILQFSSGNNHNYTLAVPKGRTLYSVQDNEDYELSGSASGSISLDSYKLGFYQGEENQFISIKNVSAFEENIVLSEQKHKMGRGYESKITSNKFQCEGTFTNYTGYTLKYAVLKTESTYYILGTIKDGETIEINKETPQYRVEKFNQYNPPLFQTQVRKMLFGKENKEDLTAEEMRHYNTVANLDYYSVLDLSGHGKCGEICASIASDEDQDNMKNEWGIDCKGVTVCRMPVKIDYKYKGDSFVVNFIKDAKDLYNVVDKSDWTFSTAKTQSVDLEYHLKSNEVLTGVHYLREVNQSIYMKDRQNYFSGDILLYNYKTGKYEVVFESGKEKSVTKVSDYVNKDNVLKIRVQVPPNRKNGSEWQRIPAISLSKREK